jgi:hypothetical protein
VHQETPEGLKIREHLDIGENPPFGTILWYWLPEGHQGPVKLTFKDGAGKDIASYASDDSATPLAKRPSTKPGLNRYVWDMRYPGPAKMDNSLGLPKPKPLVADGDSTPGPLAIPGSYTVEMAAGGATQSQGFTIVKDPRLATTLAQHKAQFDLQMELTTALDSGNKAVGRIRKLRKQLAELGGADDLKAKAEAAREALWTVERALVDVYRQSPRDALRNPAGLNDTLVDLINNVAISDREPTQQTEAVSRELMAAAAAQLAKLDAVVAGEVAAVNAMAASAGVAHVG